jgi:hypothetical protein
MVESFALSAAGVDDETLSAATGAPPFSFRFCSSDGVVAELAAAVSFPVFRKSDEE